MIEITQFRKELHQLLLVGFQGVKSEVHLPVVQLSYPAENTYLKQSEAQAFPS